MMRAVLIAAVIALLIVVVFRNTSKPDPAAAAAAKVAAENAQPTHGLSIASQSWTKGGFGAVGLMTVAVKNANEYPVKDVEVRCTFYGQSGTVVSANRQTIYENILAGETKTFREINVGMIDPQAAKASCALVYAKRPDR